MGTTYYIDEKREEENIAKAKAPGDIADICKDMGLEKLGKPAFVKKNYVKSIWNLFSFWKNIREKLNGDVVLYQYPFYGRTKKGVLENYIANYYIKGIKKKNCKFIAVVHDLDSIRKGIGHTSMFLQKSIDWSDSVFLKKFDFVICHNEIMKKCLIEKGLESDKLIPLELFDYLVKTEPEELNVRTSKGEKASIAIAGSLAIQKCEYIYHIFGDDENENTDLSVFLYGNNFDEANAHGNMIYRGSFKPEELPSCLEGDFGLVWDGPSAKTCAGNTGQYLKYNNPHKTSLYLASNMPVIVWSQAAVAKFVVENGVGITVDSLYGLDKVISHISNDEYNMMCEKVNQVGKRLRSGFYFKKAMMECLEIIAAENA